jgi:hypothetical protein
VPGTTGLSDLHIDIMQRGARIKISRQAHSVFSLPLPQFKKLNFLGVYLSVIMSSKLLLFKLGHSYEAKKDQMHYTPCHCGRGSSTIETEQEIITKSVGNNENHE